MDLYTKTWNLIENTKYKEFWIAEKAKEYKKKERNINIFLAVTSASSISSWVIWKEYAFIWASIIAISQLIQVIKPLFPFNSYIQELQNKEVLLGSINLELEKLWYKLQYDKITEKAMEREFFKIKEKINEALKFRDDIIFEETPSLESKATDKVQTFLKVTYNKETT